MINRTCLEVAALLWSGLFFLEPAYSQPAPVAPPAQNPLSVQFGTQPASVTIQRDPVFQPPFERPPPTSRGDEIGIQRELDSLRRRVEPDPGSAPPAGNSVVGVQIPDPGFWRQLKPEMTMQEVEGLLGTPDRIESRPQAVRWHWDKAKTRGWVSFGNDSRRVIEWRYF